MNASTIRSGLTCAAVAVTAVAVLTIGFSLVSQGPFADRAEAEMGAPPTSATELNFVDAKTAASPATTGPIRRAPFTLPTVPMTAPPTTAPPTTAPPRTTTPPTITAPPTTAPPTTITPPSTAPPSTAPPTTIPSTTTTTHPGGGGGGGAVHRVTNGSGRATEIDTSSPIGNVSEHGVRVYCAISHFSHDDPIVFPGQPGAAHAHMFWGNTGANHASTGTSLMATGNSSCEGGITNRSSYWIPALFNDRSEVVLPESVFVYYKSFGGPGFDRTTLQPIPAGLQMLAARAVPHSGDYHFRVGGSSNLVELHVAFPECVQVDGAGRPVLSSADNVSHLSYAAAGGPTGCPSSHPYRIPQLSYVVRFAVPFASDWSLASDHGAGAKGHSLHADYIAAWDVGSMTSITDCVIVAKRNCGFAGGRQQLPERFVGPDGNVVYHSSVDLDPNADRTPFGSAIPKMGH